MRASRTGAGVQSGALLDRRMACLSRARAALGALAEIPGAADVKALPDVARAAAALPDPAACADEALGDVEPPPAAIAPRVAQLRDDLSRARIQLAAGRVNTARDAARATAAELRSLPYRPLLAEALLVEGRALMRTDPAAAIKALDAATTAAFASHSDAIAIEAWARRAYVEGMHQGSDAAFAGLKVIEALAERTPAPFARALLANSLGSFELGRGHRAEARAAFERSQREARGATGAAAVELISVFANLALVTDDPDRRDQLSADAHAELSRLLGESHPDTLLLQHRRGATSARRLDGASALLAATCERLADHDSSAPTASPCFAELAEIRDELGDRPGAIAAYQRADGGPDSEHPERDGYLALWRGDAAAAVRAFEAALSAPPADGPKSYQQFGVEMIIVARLVEPIQRHGPDHMHGRDVAEPALVPRHALAVCLLGVEVLVDGRPVAAIEGLPLRPRIGGRETVVARDLELITAENDLAGAHRIEVLAGGRLEGPVDIGGIGLDLRGDVGLGGLRADVFDERAVIDAAEERQRCSGCEGEGAGCGSLHARVIHGRSLVLG